MTDFCHISVRYDSLHYARKRFEDRGSLPDRQSVFAGDVLGDGVGHDGELAVIIDILRLQERSGEGYQENKEHRNALETHLHMQTVSQGDTQSQIQYDEYEDWYQSLRVSLCHELIPPLMCVNV